MSVWLVASIALTVGLLACALACVRAEASAGLAALNVGGVTSVMLMVTLTEAFQRQPFIDLAIVLGALSMGGSLAFVRYLDRRR